MDEPYTYDAFISYSYQDKDRVHPIVDALKKRGLRIFLDTESISVGESLTVALERALYRSNTLIAFFSRNSPRQYFGQNLGCVFGNDAIVTERFVTGTGFF